MEGLVQSHGGSTTVSLEYMSFHELGSAASVDFSIMILTSFAHIFPPPPLQLGSWSWVWCLVVVLCIWFHQSLDEGFMMIDGVVANLITGEGQFELLPHYC